MSPTSLGTNPDKVTNGLGAALGDAVEVASLLHTSWHGRETISLENARPRMTILNTYYAKPPKENEVDDQYG